MAEDDWLTTRNPRSAVWVTYDYDEGITRKWFLSDSGELTCRESKRTPWCDCTSAQRIERLGKAQAKIVGFTKRNDGVWVRPCCMRREKAQWEKWKDAPIPAEELARREKELADAEAAHMRARMTPVQDPEQSTERGKRGRK